MEEGAIAVFQPFLTSTVSPGKMHNCIAGTVVLPSALDNLDLITWINDESLQSTLMNQNLEAIACRPHPVVPNGFNPNADIPYGCTTEHIRLAMNDFVDFLGFINQQLHTRELERFESILMPANFSSLVGEFMITSIPKYCSSLAKNQYHNGHPDLIPAGYFPNDAVQYANQGIEVKASRYLRGWQGHNPEETWLMVFVFDSNRPSDAVKGIQPKPFRFVKVVGASITKADWSFSGRSENSRRTITASVTNLGYQKMIANWIYQVPELP